MNRIGFDNAQYVKLQSEKIRERIQQFGGKLYLEFGGKLFDDYHASRVLPGFEPDSKVKMLLEMKDEAEIVIAISADDIERSKRRGDLGITYDEDSLRLIDAFRGIGLYIGSVVITHYRGQANADKFIKRLEALGVPTYKHYIIPLSQLYHEHKRGIRAGYAKFETFPIWNLPLKHPVNLAYEAATADLDDVNMIDPFHLEAYGVTTVNYNRDVVIFPVLEAMFKRIYGYSPYKSPTDMGVNMAGFCIVDDEACREASRQEVIRRWYTAACDVRRGISDPAELRRIELVMNSMDTGPKDRPVVAAALAKAEATGAPAMALELPDGTIVTGKTSSLLGPASACLLNALKALAGLDKKLLLIAPGIIQPIQHLKVEHLGNHNPRLHTDELLIALSICEVTNPTAGYALDQLYRLRGCEAHSTVILSHVDADLFKKLGVNLSCEPRYQAKKLYHK